MRTFAVPDTINVSKVLAFIADLGVEINRDDLLELHLGMDGVYVEFYDRLPEGDPNAGMRYFNPPGGDEPAKHRISIRLNFDA